MQQHLSLFALPRGGKLLCLLTLFSSMIAGSYAQRNQDFTYCWNHKLTQNPNGKFDKGKDVATYLPHNAVYVVGQTKGGDYHRGFVVRLEACGQGTRVKWIKYIESSTGNASANAVAVDGAGFVYVAGFVHVSGEGHNVFLAKYDPEDGDYWLDEQTCGEDAVPFFITYDRDDQDDEAVDLAVTHDGHAFLAATTKGGEFASTDVTVMRAKKCPIMVDDPTPHVEGWEWIAIDETGSNDKAIGIGLQSAHIAYATPYVLGQVAGDFATYKHSVSTGAQQWKRAWGSGQHTDIPTSIAVLASGHVYVAGSAHTDSTRNFDAVILKYDTNGDLSTSWAGNGQTPDDDTVGVRRWNGNANGNDRFNAIVASAAGHVYATGLVIQTEALGDENMGTRKYTVGGAFDWEAVYSHSNGWDEGTAIALDAFGNCYVAGASHKSASSSEFAMVSMKYKRAGSGGQAVQVDNAIRRGDQDDGDHLPAAIACDELHRAFVTGIWGTNPSQTVSAQAYTFCAITTPDNGDVKDGEDSYNHIIDDDDLARVLEEYGFTGSGLESDLNEDGIVDDTDLAAVLALFGLGCGENRTCPQ